MKKIAELIVSPLFIDFMVEVNDFEVVYFMDCYNIRNYFVIPNKLEQIFVKPFTLDTDSNEFWF